MKYFARGSSDQEYAIELQENLDGTYNLLVNDQSISVDLKEISHGHLYSLLLNQRSHDVTVEPSDEGLGITMEGQFFSFNVLDETQKRLEQSGGQRRKKAGPSVIKAEMPGVVIRAVAKDGDTVNKGDVLLVVEAMKMQNEIVAPAQAKVKQILVQEGAVLAAGDGLVKLDYQQ